jgi:hypothetical protein
MKKIDNKFEILIVDNNENNQQDDLIATVGTKDECPVCAE